MTMMQIPMKVTAFLTGLSDNPYVILLLINLLLLVLGTLMDMAPLILILTPILLPVVKTLGVDPVHFGMIMMVNLGIGLITPPVGTVLNTVAGVGKVSMDVVTRGVMPFMLAQFAVMFLMVLFPQLVMVPARWFY
jgi:TRAP-type C4-dicarboxylate transport system permease large subunit